MEFNISIRAANGSNDYNNILELRGLKEVKLQEELFQTLDYYRSERDLAMGLKGYTEAEVRRRLKKLVVKLRKCVPAKPSKSRKNSDQSSRT